MENKKIDNINNANHYQICGFNSIEIIKRVLGLRGFVAFCLGNILKYLIRAEKKNKLEDYKKAAKYLAWVIEREGTDKYEVIQIVDAEELEKYLGVEWSKIISEIAKDLNVENAFELDSIFRNIFSENYEMARDILDDFIKEYEE
nr:MAG TPA: nucelotide kinase [Caudoviricetes sp.]